MNRLCQPAEPVALEDRTLTVRLWREACRQQQMETSWHDAVREFDRGMFLRSLESVRTADERR